MSEYQYYEFLAIDRPLTEDEMAELRALSTRATITPVSFTNEYNWGDFKGNPDKLMQRYFDAHVYVANWMTAIFMLRLPIDTLAQETAEAFEVPYTMDLKATKTHWIITWHLEESENYDRFGMDDGHGWMARLVAVRDELLRGDICGLYIGWLAAVATEMMDEDEMEPLAVSGLGSLTAAQQSLAEFLEVDPDLLEGAGMGSPMAEEEGISPKEMDEWIDALPRDEVKAILKTLLEGRVSRPNNRSGTGSRHGSAACEATGPKRPGARLDNCGRMPRRLNRSGWKSKNVTTSGGRSSAERSARCI